MDLFDTARPGFNVIFRYGHILSGITWIGLLYFFNFVQTPSFAELSDGARSEALRSVTNRALWWFRWGAASTLAFGLLLIFVQDDIGDYFDSSTGYAISTGILFAVTMFLNVWLVIWPAQKKLIAAARATAEGGTAPAVPPDTAKRSARASRANTFMSIPMLWFMVFAAHLAGATELQNEGLYWLFVIVCWGVVEASALGLLGGYDNAINKTLFDKHQNTILYGFVYLVAFYLIGWELIASA